MFDHTLKLRRALKHLQDLDTYVTDWIGEKHYGVRYEYEPEARWDGPIPPGKSNVPPDTWRSYLAGPVFLPGQPRESLTDEFGLGRLTAFVTAEQPPSEPISLLVGDLLHNLRSTLDLLAFALATTYTKPLPKEVADGSEFPVFGDEDRQGKVGVGVDLFHRTNTKTGKPVHGSGLLKISGWHPDAQTVVEGLQPYHRGKDFRSDPLWLIHDLDRISKHRLLHPAIAAFAGTHWDVLNARNLRAIGPGFLDSYGGTFEGDTPIARVVGVQRLDPSADVHMPIAPALAVTLGPSAGSADGQHLVPTLAELYNYVAVSIIPALAPYL